MTHRSPSRRRARHRAILRAAADCVAPLLQGFVKTVGHRSQLPNRIIRGWVRWGYFAISAACRFAP